jgi:hypothetical protein
MSKLQYREPIPTLETQSDSKDSSTVAVSSQHDMVLHRHQMIQESNGYFSDQNQIQQPVQPSGNRRPDLMSTYMKADSLELVNRLSKRLYSPITRKV